MNARFVEYGIPAIVAVIGITVLAQWFLPLWRSTRAEAVPRPPVTEQAPAVPAPSPPVAATTVATTTPTLEMPGAWPRFRGPNGDNVSPDATPLARAWPATGPAVRWSVPLGEGYAGPAVLRGRVYLLDHDPASRADILRCLALADGGERWRLTMPADFQPNHGYSRTVPAVTERYIVVITPLCQVVCADAATGTQVWAHDLVKAYRAKVPDWYAGQCPVIDGERVIIATGGDALLVAFDLATGKELWRTPNPRGLAMSHGSITVATLAGRRMYVYSAGTKPGAVVGVAPEDGTLLWQADWHVPTANVPTPVTVGDDRLFLCGGYNAGAMMLRVAREGDAFTARELFRVPASTFGSEQQTPILYQGHLYGVNPRKQLTCLDLNGAVVWQSGPTKQFGLNAFVIATGNLYLLTDRGELVLVPATPTGYSELARASIMAGGREFWGPMAVVGRYLLVRDATRLLCLDIGTT